MDNYLKDLHRGEHSLTASQARQSNDGSATNQMAAAVAAAVSDAISNMQMVLDKKVVGKVFGDTVTRRVDKNINLSNDQIAYGHGNGR